MQKTSDPTIGDGVEEMAATPLLPPARPAPRVWPAAALVAGLWGFHLVVGRLELTTFGRFGVTFLVQSAVVLGVLLWWMISRRTSWGERLAGLGAIIGLNVLGERLSHRSLHGIMWVMMVVPIMLTAWVAWWAVARRRRPAVRIGGLVGIVAITCGLFTLLRVNGISGEQKLAMSWRWSLTAEERHLAEIAQPQAATTSAVTASVLAASAEDWPGFRGAGRDGVVRGGLRVATDWDARPPRLRWRVGVGPGWSSPVVVGERVFTQEQEGAREVVVCRDAGDGRVVWKHADAARFEESMSGAGPRATPEFAGGKLYALGGTGVLNCLDADTGAVRWARNLVTDHGAKPPMWGFASSPLLAGGVVIVYAGDPKGLVAYRADSGEPVWSTPMGRQSYTSAQLARLGGQEQVLFFSDAGLASVDPADGRKLWEHAIPAPGMWRAVQPHPISESQVLVASESDLGTALIEVSHSGDGWWAQRKWASRALKPAFNDFVVYDGYAYGFDGGVFCCTELAAGKRRWRDGRYGHGQVVLLAEQGLLMVTTEDGAVELVRAASDRLEELGRIDGAVAGKAWNHPAVARGKLVVRSDQEMACFEVAAEAK